MVMEFQIIKIIAQMFLTLTRLTLIMMVKAMLATIII